MRGLVLGGVIVVLGWAAPAVAQDTPPRPFERLVETNLQIRVPVHECSVPAAVLALAKQAGMPAGAEYLPVDCQQVYRARANTGELLTLRGLTVGEALRKVSQLDPRYRWIESDGVIVIRPVDAWADPRNMLNFESATFVLDDATLGAALDAVTSAVSGQPGNFHSNLGTGTDQGARRFSVKTGATSAGGVLDAIVRAHGAAWWEVKLGTSRPSQLGPVIWLFTFDGTGIGAGTVRAR